MLSSCRNCAPIFMKVRSALASLRSMLSLVPLLLAPQLARAVEWSAEPSVSLKSLYTDNFNLIIAPHPNVWGLILSPGVTLNGESEIWKVTGGANVNVNRYFGQDELNTTDGALTLRSAYRAERNTFGLNLYFIRDNTLVGELATTGVIQAYAPRTELTLNPTYSRALTEQIKLVANYRFTDVHYSNTAGTRLIDYRDQIASVGLQQDLSERTVATVSGYFDLFETDPAHFKARTVGIQGGIIHAFSETERASLTAGPVTTRSTTSSKTPVCNAPIVFGVCSGSISTLASEITSTSSELTFTADVAKQWQETASATVRVSRELNPSGVGALVRTDLLRLTMTYELSPTLTGMFDAGIYRSRYVGAAIATNQVGYLRVEPRVRWRISPAVTIEAGYAFARQKYDAQPDTATANSVYVTVSYSWKKISVSG